MYKTTRFDGERLRVDPGEYLRRHDTVYLSPAYEGYNGLPLGNGSFGGMLFHSPRSLELPLNHTDLYDYVGDGRFSCWAREAEEKHTAPQACGRLSITDFMPSFDWMYLKKFEQRLNLAQGTVECEAETAFSKIFYKAYAAAEPAVLTIHYRAEYAQETELEIELERWSSPSFFHHYEQIVAVHDKNLDTTASFVENETALITQKLRRCCGVTAAALDVDALPVCRGAHRVVFTLPKSKKHEFTLYLTALASDRDGEGELDRLKKEAAAVVAGARRDGERIWERHLERWSAFWSKSFVRLDGEDYLENLYYLHLYQMGSSSLGKLPLTFAGLWAWNRDVRNWGHFYHWNHQQTYWGLYAANHPELAENYLDYRFGMLPNARKDAEEIHGARGAYFSDISNLNGYNAIEPDSVRNYTVGAQIALDFARRYRYTMDREFLARRALPFMKASADFYLSLLEMRDGAYRVRGGSTAYESYWNLKESITDHVAVKALFLELASLGSECGELSREEAGRYREVAENLFPLRLEEVTHNGEQMKIFTVGSKWDGGAVAYGEGDYPMSPFPACLTAPVYPAGLIGLADEGSEAFELMRNTARVLFDRDVYLLGRLGCSGHCPSPETAARLGMAGDAVAVMRAFVAKYQIFSNGLFHFADVSQNQQWSRVNKPCVLPPDIGATDWEELHEKTRGIRTEIGSDPFLHCYFEALANIFAGINETLLQSHGGVIRVFPALAGGGLFRLAAEGGFIVTSEKSGDEIRFIYIDSPHGGVCRVASPWGDAPLRVTADGADADFEMEGGVLSISTAPGDRRLICPAEFPLELYYPKNLESVPNRAPKELSGAVLGRKRIY